MNQSRIFNAAILRIVSRWFWSVYRCFLGNTFPRRGDTLDYHNTGFTAAVTGGRVGRPGRRCLPTMKWKQCAHAPLTFKFMYTRHPGRVKIPLEFCGSKRTQSKTSYAHLNNLILWKWYACFVKYIRSVSKTHIYDINIKRNNYIELDWNNKIGPYRHYCTFS